MKLNENKVEAKPKKQLSFSLVFGLSLLCFCGVPNASVLFCCYIIFLYKILKNEVSA